MKTSLNRILTACSLFATLWFSAQRHELGVQGGMANIVGDIGRTTFVLQKPLGNISYYGLPVYGGLIYRMNFNPYQTLRFNLGYSAVQFSDAVAKENYRRYRYGSDYYPMYDANNDVLNADVQFEYNFFPVNDEQQGMFSPYIFGGVGGIMFSDRTATLDFSGTLYDLDDSGEIDAYPTDYTDRVTNGVINNYALSIPFGAGLKYKFNYNWAIFGEFKFRYTFTDNIDYSNLDEKNVRVVGKVFQGNGEERKLTQTELEKIRRPYIKTQQIGNPNSNDWINTVILGISYSFGRPPCYCN